jgi:hypothetical protein
LLIVKNGFSNFVCWELREKSGKDNFPAQFSTFCVKLRISDYIFLNTDVGVGKSWKISNGINMAQFTPTPPMDGIISRSF